MSYDLYVGDNLVKDVDVPSSITKINDVAFYNSTITSLTAAEGLESVGYYSFNKCSSLESVSLPSTTRYMACTFEGCTALRSLRIASTVPPEANLPNYGYLDTDFDSKVAEQCTLYVPKESVETYRKDTRWGVFKNIVGF